MRLRRCQFAVAPEPHACCVTPCAASCAGCVPSRRPSRRFAALATLEAEYERLNALRMDALVALRGEGLGYDAIGAATGLSRSRVAQLLRQARAR